MTTMLKETPNLRSTRPQRKKGKSMDPNGYKDIKNVLHNHQQKQVERSSARSAAYHEQKRLLYAQARKTAREISTSGITYIEEMQANYRQLREQEKSSENLIQDYKRLERSREEAFDILSGSCNKLVHELGLKRSSQVDSACEMVNYALTSRQEVLKASLKRARKELERVREAEKIASDATEMINYYKGLLRATSSDV